MRIIRFSELTETPWKNGGGITREIAEARQDGALVWRLSMADVAGDGPFSNFAGLVRILTVIDGGGMALVSPDGVLEADYGKPVRFDGGLAITARLKDGPLRDLNVMFDPQLCDGDVTRVGGPYDLTHHAGPSETVGVHCLKGIAGVGKAQLNRGDTALIERAAAAIRLDEAASVLLIRIVRAEVG